MCVKTYTAHIGILILFIMFMRLGTEITRPSEYSVQAAIATLRAKESKLLPYYESIFGPGCKLRAVVPV